MWVLDSHVVMSSTHYIHAIYTILITCYSTLRRNTVPIDNQEKEKEKGKKEKGETIPSFLPIVGHMSTHI
jgi:hypothetical protein